MTLRNLIDEIFSLNEEEELDATNLSVRMQKAKNAVEATVTNFIATMNSTDIHKELNLEFPDELKTLLGDAWELKDFSTKLLKKQPNNPLALKAVSDWNDMRKSLNKLKAKILEWNRKHPNNQLPNVEEIAGLPIREFSDDEIEKLWKELLPEVEKLPAILDKISKGENLSEDAEPGFIDKEN